MDQRVPGLVVTRRPDPSVEEWFFNPDHIPLINTSAYDQLLSDLKRYLDGEVRGMSFLIAGHRGSGKTTLVWQACRALYGLSSDAATQCHFRPLVIPLNGPKFLPSIEGGAFAEAAGRPDKKVDGNGAQPTRTTDGLQELSDVERALVEFTVALYGALAAEMARCFRNRAMETGSRRRADRQELAGQLEIELDVAPSAGRLREFWRQAGFLEDGVLFPMGSSARPGFSARPDQGVRELVAISSAADAYRRVSGTFVATSEKDEAEAGRTSSIQVDAAPKGQDLIVPLTSLATGGLVGVGLGAALSQPVTGAITGLLTALGAASVFKLSSTRRQTRTMSRATEFERDLTLATLDREVPRLLQRLREAGLAPVFIVDELDKVPLEQRITNLVRDLKTLVAERACFCFLTDRSYYESLQTLELEHPYPREYTYFKRRLFIAAGHRELHKYLTEVIVVEQTEEPTATIENDREILPYCLLHQARMHPIDLDRALARLVGEDGRLAVHPGTVVSTSAYQLDLLMQLAVEMLLDTPDVTSMLERRPESKRLVHDSLYYLSRHWADRGNQDLELARTKTSGATYNEEFIHDLVGRMRTSGPLAPSTAPDVMSDEEAARRRELERKQDAKLLATIPLYERNWLFELVRRQAEMLAEPLAYCRELKSWLMQQHDGIPIQECLMDPGVEVLISTLPLELSRGPLLRRIDEDSFRWRYDQFGRGLSGAEQTWSDQVDLMCELIGELTIQRWDSSMTQPQLDREAMLRVLRYPRRHWHLYHGEQDLLLDESDENLKKQIDTALENPDIQLTREVVALTLRDALQFHCAPATALSEFDQWSSSMPLPSLLRYELRALLEGEPLLQPHPSKAECYQWRFSETGEPRFNGTKAAAPGMKRERPSTEMSELAFVKTVIDILRGM